MSSEVLAAAIGAIGAIILALLGQIGARFLGIGEQQQNLVNILKSTVDAQKDQIEELQRSDQSKNERIANLEQEVIELKELTISQAKKIDILTKRRRTANHVADD